MGDLAYGVPQKARDAEVYMVTKSTFIDFPNLWVGPEPDVAHEDLGREPVAEGLQLGHRGARDVDFSLTACRSRASSTSPRISIRRRSTR
jgi:hypothetical protein